MSIVKLITIVHIVPYNRKSLNKDELKGTTQAAEKVHSILASSKGSTELIAELNTLYQVWGSHPHTRSSSHLRTILPKSKPKSSSRPLPASWPNLAT